ncbi:uncharacterized protein KD926_006318 [Aspergillus affinis]|uniref:uncharacterized protein n=1 Tax=Aspergillus affinis TaxID=1070780 RepID=UPI0022FE83A9|nr:uncharacterized protein KD926_006318 [Aspergillus affinis]KAI9041981.1 hypothetical protein KD926_006318 [Aspergillus affinis]
MPWASNSSSRDSSRSSSSSQSSDGYALSVNIHGDGRNPASPAHWEAMIHKRGAKEGEHFRVRKNEDFYYDPPKNSRPIDATYGRTEISHFSGSRKKDAERILNDYGRNHANLPRGSANSQNWTVGALGALERERLAPEGTKRYWGDNVGRQSADVADRLRRDGTSWISNSVAQGQHREASRPVGRLDINALSGRSGRSR